MINEHKLEKRPVSNRGVYSALVQMPAPKLTRLSKRVEALRKELRFIPLQDGVVVVVVVATRQLLKVWSHELNRLLAVEQTKDTHERLGDWDNEGGQNG